MFMFGTVRLIRSTRFLFVIFDTFCSSCTKVPTHELDSLPHVTLTTITHWDPSQASYHLHEMEEEKEVNQEAVRASVVAMYEKAWRVAASIFSKSDWLLRVVSSTRLIGF